MTYLKDKVSITIKFTEINDLFLSYQGYETYFIRLKRFYKYLELY